MFKHTNHQEVLINEALELFKLLYEDDDLKPCTVKPHFDHINTPVVDKEGVLVPEFWIFLDKLLSAIPHNNNNTRHFIASSIESFYTLIEYLRLIKKSNSSTNHVLRQDG